MKRIFLVDGMAILYRAHYAMINNPLTTESGIHTSAIFGFFNTIFKIFKEENPDYFLVLPWHFRDFIVQKEKSFLNNGGKLIFPLPDIEII